MSSYAGVERPAGETMETAVSDTVIFAVAARKEVDPIDLAPLYEAIDPDALDALFQSEPWPTRTPGRVEFTYSGCDVVVEADGTVNVSKTA